MMNEYDVNDATQKVQTNGGSDVFDRFCHAFDCPDIMSTFQLLCDLKRLVPADCRQFHRRLLPTISCHKAQALRQILEKRDEQAEYQAGEACSNLRVLIVGAGICGLRTAIEVALLGGRAVVIEKRNNFTRNNVLHLWPFLITDLRNLGVKVFYPKFCSGAIDHISIKRLQSALLKVALVLGVEVHTNVSFVDYREPSSLHRGWTAVLEPGNHVVSDYKFDVLIGADGKRNTLRGFKRKEFRGKLAIAITANFVNYRTSAEARVTEIGGLTYFLRQQFFKNLKETLDIDLENFVYFKDETHYFVMTAKKQSLLATGVIKEDYSDAVSLLSHDNVCQERLENFAREAANAAAGGELPKLDFAVNHYGQNDVAMFDFTSIFAAEYSSRIVERQGQKLLMALVGDSLLEPFWPTGSGCAKGFLSSMDAAWMMRQWRSGEKSDTEVLRERESIYKMLSCVSNMSLKPNYSKYTIDPTTRYLSRVGIGAVSAQQVAHLYDTETIPAQDQMVQVPVIQDSTTDT